MSPDLLVGLANSLLDGTVFQIISGISELQRMEEENLFNTRKKLVADFAGTKLSWSFLLKGGLGVIALCFEHSAITPCDMES